MKAAIPSGTPISTSKSPARDKARGRLSSAMASAAGELLRETEHRQHPTLGAELVRVTECAQRARPAVGSSGPIPAAPPMPAQPPTPERTATYWRPLGP